jgi:hypothetical protein
MGLFGRFSKKEIPDQPLNLSYQSYQDIVDFSEDRRVPTYPDLADAIDTLRSESVNSPKWEFYKTFFQKKIDEIPDFDVPYIWLSRCYQNTHNNIEAIATLEKGMKNCVRKAHLYNHEAIFLLFDLKNPKDALYCFTATLKVCNVRHNKGGEAFNTSLLYLDAIFNAYGFSKGSDTIKLFFPPNLDLSCDRQEQIGKMLTKGDTKISKDDLENTYMEIKNLGVRLSISGV